MDSILKIVFFALLALTFSMCSQKVEKEISENAALMAYFSKLAKEIES